MFKFTGTLGSSKSIFNRLLVVRSFASELEILGQSESQDVKAMLSIVEDLESRTEFNAHNAGTAFRFGAFLISRRQGDFFLKAESQLLRRPHEPLIQLLFSLGVSAKLEKRGLRIQSEGWKKPNQELWVDRSFSSQFASGMLLSSWGLDFELELKMSSKELSEGYLQLTAALLRQMGMHLQESGDRWTVPPMQRVRPGSVYAEPDVSSVFALACAALIGGEISIQFPGWRSSLQPDVAGLQALFAIQDRLEVSDRSDPDTVSFTRQTQLAPLQFDLSRCPDLFPCMASLAAFCQGVSSLRVPSHLDVKESPRLQKTKELLQLANVDFEIMDQYMQIHGRGLDRQVPRFQFDPADDHRMAMAAGLFQLREPGIEILNPDCVQKSFPDFWKILRGDR